jgi:predicted GNAT family acetyltransferase
MGENNFTKNPVAFYGFVLLMCALAFNILQKFCLNIEGKDSVIAKALESTLKEKLSGGIYISGIVLSFYYPIIAVLLYYTAALLWIIQDLRIEKTLKLNKMIPQNDNMVTIKQNEETFDVFYDNEKAGFMAYKRKDDFLEIIHTEVSEEFGGKGLGKELVAAAVEFAKNNNLRIIAYCPFAKKIIMKTPEFKAFLEQ